MPDPISPISGASGARLSGRRLSDEDESGAQDHEAEAKPPTPPARVDPPPQMSEPPRSRRAALAAFAAQLLGQAGIKRGLRGGPETLGKARAAYLETEWSGPSDRRLRNGRITKTEI